MEFGNKLQIQRSGAEQVFHFYFLIFNLILKIPIYHIQPPSRIGHNRLHDINKMMHGLEHKTMNTLGLESK